MTARRATNLPGRARCQRERQQRPMMTQFLAPVAVADLSRTLMMHDEIVAALDMIFLGS